MVNQTMGALRSNAKAVEGKNYHLKVLEGTPEWFSASSSWRSCSTSESTSETPPRPKLMLQLHCTASPSASPKTSTSSTQWKHTEAKLANPPARIETPKKTQRLKLNADPIKHWARKIRQLGCNAKELNENMLEGRALISEASFLKYEEQQYRLVLEVCESLQDHDLINHFPRIGRLIARLGK